MNLIHGIFILCSLWKISYCVYYIVTVLPYKHGVIMNEDLVKKFGELKSRHAELTAEKVKYEARKEQLSAEIKSIQDKYTEYDLSSIASVEKIIKDLTTQLDNELNSINEQYAKIKAV